MVVTTMGREDNTAKESTLAILPVCCFGVFFNLFVVFHMLAMADGQQPVATMMGREDNTAEESTLAILPVCCFLGFFNLFVVSHMLAMEDGQRPGGWWRR